MYRLFISETAENDLENIVSYILNKLLNKSATINFLDEVEAAYERITLNPFLYPKCTNLKLNKLGYRKVIIKNYALIYRIDYINKLVYVVNFFHLSQDYENRISEI